MEEAVHDKLVALLHLFGGERYLGEVVLAAVGVVLGAVGLSLNRVGAGSLAGHRVGLLWGQGLLVARCRHHRLVYPLPVVHILALAPEFLERGLTLAHRHGVIEVPLAVALLSYSGLLGVGTAVAGHSRLTPVLALHGLGIVLLLGTALLFLFLLQGRYHAVYGSIALGLAHAGQGLQRVLQGHGLGMGHQFVQHLRPLRQLPVVGAVLVQQSDGLAIAAARIRELLALPVQVAQTQEQHTFLDTATGGLAVARLVGRQGVQGVAVGQIDVADGVIYLVEIFLVVVRGCHTAQPAYHTSRLTLGHHLGLCDTRVELQFVRRVEPYHPAVSAVSRVGLAHSGIELTQQEPLTGTLLTAHLVVYHPAHIGYGAVVVGRTERVVGIGIVPLLDGAPVHRVAGHVAYHVLGIVEPAPLSVALGEPGPGLAVDSGLGGIETAHVREGRGRLVEGSHVKLGTAHEHPGFPEEGVVLATAEPLDVAGCLAPLLVPYGTALDAVLVYGFLGLGHRRLVVRLAQLATGLVAHRVEGYQLGIVVLVAPLFLQGAFHVGHRAVIVSVVARLEGMPPARRRRVLLGRAPREGQDCQRPQQGPPAQQGHHGGTSPAGQGIDYYGHQDNGGSRGHIEQIRERQPGHAVYPADDDAQPYHTLVAIGKHIGRHLGNGEQTDGQHHTHQAQRGHYGHGDEGHHSVLYQTDGQPP